MNARHLTQQELQRYVLDALPPHEAEALEAHVASCPRCAAALQTEARVEVALQEVLPQARALTAIAAMPQQQPSERAPNARATARVTARAWAPNGRAIARATQRAQALPRHAPWLLMTAAAVLALVCLPHGDRGPRNAPAFTAAPGSSEDDPGPLLSSASLPGASEEATLLCALAPSASAARPLCLASQGPFCGPQPTDEAVP